MTSAVNVAQYGGVGSTKNRIINGNMMIDQRGSAASPVTNNSNVFKYSVDRMFSIGQVTDGVFTTQQSSTAPAGFSKSFLTTVTTADASIGASNYYFVGQYIEGFNIADLGWGAANASTVTLSFWVRSSVTGSFGGSLQNSATTRSYPFLYTISSANTWEQKTITIAGDTTGTWLTDNGTGIALNFGLGMGSSLSGTAGAWAGAAYYSATGATNIISTNGATFYITGVQLEAGTAATPFENRLYGTELALCQRYYSTIGSDQQGYSPSGYAVIFSMTTPQPMRANATVTYSTASTTNFSSVSFNQDYPSCVRGVLGSNAANTSVRWLGNIFLSAEL